MKYIDGWLYAGISFCQATVAYLAISEAKEFVGQPTLFWSVGFTTVLGQVLLAVKTWRSTGYKDSKTKNENKIQ